MSSNAAYEAPELIHYGDMNRLTAGQAIYEDFDSNFTSGNEIPTDDDGNPLIGSAA